MFNADDFLSSSNEAILDDKFNQVDAGEYNAQVGVDDKALEIATGEKDGKPWAKLTVKLEILDPSKEIEKKLGRPPSIRYSFFLDLDDSGRIDQSPQKNVRLGAVLKATGCAKPGWKPTDIKGKSLKIRVAKVKNDLNPAEPRSEVVSVGMPG